MPATSGNTHIQFLADMKCDFKNIDDLINRGWVLKVSTNKDGRQGNAHMTLAQVMKLAKPNKAAPSITDMRTS